MRRLLLIRHAKSSHKDTTLADHDRPLNKRGDQDRKSMSEHLQQRGENLQVVYSSSAIRSLIYAQTLCQQLGIPLVTESAFYTFSPSTLINVLTQLPDNIHQLAVVGHNPAITSVVNHLVKENIINVPTSGIAALNCPIESWSSIDRITSELDYFIYPKML